VRGLTGVINSFGSYHFIIRKPVDTLMIELNQIHDVVISSLIDLIVDFGEPVMSFVVCWDGMMKLIIHSAGLLEV